MNSNYPQPSTLGTGALLIALFLAYQSGEAEVPSEPIRKAALLVGVGFLVSLFFDLEHGLKNLIRADVVSILSLYVLTLLEFLFSQEQFNSDVNALASKDALNMVLLGFAGLAVGRHFFTKASPSASLLSGTADIPASWLVRLCLVFVFLATLHMLIAVNFNILRIIEILSGPRFHIPWGRGRYGSWKALLNELAMLYYLIPPLCAVIFIRRRELSNPAVIAVALAFLFTLFQSFAGGTRNVFLTHLASFGGAFILFIPKLNLKKLFLVASFDLIIAGFGSYHMLEFRKMGLQRYLEKQQFTEEHTRDQYVVDNNLMAISRLAEGFPGSYGFLGWEVPQWALAKPIPRALWSGKPLGLSISIEEALDGNAGYTIATTFIGEAYMGFGWKGIIITSLLFGFFAGQWNRINGDFHTSLSVVLYASGFFAAAISIRSLFWFTTAILPPLALYCFWRFFLRDRLGDRSDKEPEDKLEQFSPIH